MIRTSNGTFAYAVIGAVAVASWLSACGNRLGPDTQTGTTPDGGDPTAIPCDPNAVPFGGGVGTADDPYRLCSRAQWIQMASGATAGLHFRVVGELDFQNKAVPTVDDFQGTLDGHEGKLRHVAGLPLFVQLSGIVRNVAMTEVAIVSGTNVGPLAGIVTSSGIVEDVSVSGTVFGSFNAGGLVGINSGTLRGIDAAVAVEGVTRVGGIAGIDNGVIAESFAHGTVKGSQYVGGVAGTLGFQARVQQVVVGPSVVTASGDVVGGVAGDSGALTVVEDVVAVADVSGASSVGGAVGSHAGSLSRVLAAGSLTGTGAGVDALCGSATGTASSSYFDTTKSGVAASDCGQGKTTSALYEPATYVGWDTVTTWLVNGVSYPTLRQ